MALAEVKVVVATASNRVGNDVLALGRDRGLLVCRACVMATDADRHYLIGLPSNDPQRRISLAELNAALEFEAPGVIAVLVNASGEGWAEAEAAPRSARETVELAAVVTAVQSSWGWDESAVIAVSVGGYAVTAAARFDGDYWSVLVPDPEETVLPTATPN